MATHPKERWFVAVLIFESSIREGWSDPKVDVQHRLIRAIDADAAWDRARALGERNKRSYENPHGQTCVWTFKGLGDLQEVTDDELGHGVEIYGFIEDGRAEDHVVMKGQLTAFLDRQDS